MKKLAIIDRSRSGTIWMFVGLACGAFLNNFSLGLGIPTVIVLVVVALVRRRVDSYSQFAIGFILGLAVIVALVIRHGLT